MQIDFSEWQKPNVPVSSQRIREPVSDAMTSTSSEPAKKSAVKAVNDSEITRILRWESVFSLFSRARSSIHTVARGRDLESREWSW
jgi:hypothetical protein